VGLAVPERIKIMEHIVQFGISIDDDTISKRIQENAEKIIIQKIEQDVKKNIFSTDYRGNSIALNYTAENIFKAWLDSHADEIIQIASKALADRMVKTKAVKEAINNVLEGNK
jgi:hypothetical protein